MLIDDLDDQIGVDAHTVTICVVVFGVVQVTSADQLTGRNCGIVAVNVLVADVPATNSSATTWK